MTDSKLTSCPRLDQAVGLLAGQIQPRAWGGPSSSSSHPVYTLAAMTPAPATCHVPRVHFMPEWQLQHEAHSNDNSGSETSTVHDLRQWQQGQWRRSWGNGQNAQRATRARSALAQPPALNCQVHQGPRTLDSTASYSLPATSPNFW